MKRVWKIILIIFLVLLLILAGVVIYFYKFHTYYTVRLCLSEDGKDLKIPCDSNKECLNLIKNSDDFNRENFPEVFEEEVEEIMNKMVYCEETCRIREIYGEGVNNEGHVDECREGEEEFECEINGEKGIELWKATKN
jgi:hypothetical protein